ncbi:MAG TPA: hypothetical protein VNL17_11500 [Verrucomicrobiae bacterium]|nr:hypothetical protein [Verrucomicrobiae bacterium]
MNNKAFLLIVAVVVVAAAAIWFGRYLERMDSLQSQVYQLQARVNYLEGENARRVQRLAGWKSLWQSVRRCIPFLR